MTTEIEDSGRNTRKCIVVAAILQVVLIAIFSVYFIHSMKTSLTDSNEKTRQVIEDIREGFDND